MKPIFSHFVCAGLAIAYTANAELTLDGKAKVYVGEHGEQVTLVPLKPKSAKKVLLKFEGTDSEWDGKIILHSVNEYNGKADFKTKWKDKDFVTIAARDAWWTTKQFYLSTPGKQDGVPIFYNDKKTEKVDGNELVSAYSG